jgi:hypothetical protein
MKRLMNSQLQIHRDESTMEREQTGAEQVASARRTPLIPMPSR